MIVLNLGCGNKTSSNPDVINIDWSIYFILKRNRLLKYFVPFFLHGQRLKRYSALPCNVKVHNLRNGIPYNRGSVDVVYHSHFLEHLDRGMARKYLLDVVRVLKPGGIHRIVVPDFEALCKKYVDHIETCEVEGNEIEKHENYIADIIEQSVRKESFGSGQQRLIVRFIENVLFGDARKRGETHQWMYDRISLKAALLDSGYKEVVIQKYNTSLIPKWNEYGLDLNEYGRQYKSSSLYVEAIA